MSHIIKGGNVYKNTTLGKSLEKKIADEKNNTKKKELQKQLKAITISTTVKTKQTYGKLDKGPSFLTSALGPSIDIAKDFEKTIRLMISGISGIISGIKKAANFVGKLFI